MHSYHYFSKLSHPQQHKVFRSVFMTIRCCRFCKDILVNNYMHAKVTCVMFMKQNMHAV